MRDSKSFHILLAEQGKVRNKRKTFILWIFSQIQIEVLGASRSHSSVEKRVIIRLLPPKAAAAAAARRGAEVQKCLGAFFREKLSYY